jgi:hypothetical protein
MKTNKINKPEYSNEPNEPNEPEYSNEPNESNESNESNNFDISNSFYEIDWVGMEKDYWNIESGVFFDPIEPDWFL